MVVSIFISLIHHVFTPTAHSIKTTITATITTIATAIPTASTPSTTTLPLSNSYSFLLCQLKHRLHDEAFLP